MPAEAAWPAGGPASSDIAAQVADRIDLDRALSSIPEDQRAAIVIRDLLDFDYAAVAAILGVPAGTVKSRIARGRAALAAALGSSDDGEPLDEGNRAPHSGRQNEGETSGRRS